MPGGIGIILWVILKQRSVFSDLLPTRIAVPIPPVLPASVLGFTPYDRDAACIVAPTNFIDTGLACRRRFIVRIKSGDATIHAASLSGDP
jgi:hypothetical protein